jgi:UDP-N-acetylmuramyl pentapeptide phosphotransferase/UDP-N-acetylglucosamine-1-phosphate transferase
MAEIVAIVTLTMILAGLITWWIIPHVVRIVKVRGIFDHPDNDRKLHMEPTPVLGGIGIFLGFMVALVGAAELMEIDVYSYFRLSVVILLFVGIADDLVPIPASRKMLFMILAGALVLIDTNSWIIAFNGVVGISTIPIYFAMPLSLFVMVLIINAYNMIDGVDGLAGSQGAMAGALFGVLFLLNGYIGLSLISFALAGALIGFLFHNRPPARIFMGDTGSLVVGFVLAFLAIEFVSVLGTNNAFTINAYTPVLVVAILIVPLFDVLRVVILRKLSGRLAFSPSREHVHHVLLDYGFGARGTSIYLLLVQLMITLSAYTMAQIGMNINLVLASTLITAVLVLPMRPGHVFVLYWMGWRPKHRPIRVPASISLRLVGDNEPKIPKRDLNHSKTEEVSDH